MRKVEERFKARLIRYADDFGGPVSGSDGEGAEGNQNSPEGFGRLVLNEERREGREMQGREI